MDTSLLLETLTTMMMIYVCNFAGDALCSRPIINQHKSRRESKCECFVVSLLHFQGSACYFPDRRVEGQDHLEGSKRQDMFSARMGTWLKF